MRDYGKISTSLWRSQKFRGLEHDAHRYLYMYLHTCTHVNSVGCFVLPMGYITADLGWSEERSRKGIETLCHTHLIGYSWDAEVVRIVDFLTHDPFCNKNHAKGGVKLALSLPDCYEKLCILKEIAENKYISDEPLRNPIETLSKRFPNGIPPEPEPEPDIIPTSSGAGAPSVWDVWLGIVGKSDTNRSFLGKQIKEFSEPVVAKAVAELSTRQPRPADPKQFLVGMLRDSGESESTSTRKRSLQDDLTDTSWAGVVQ